MRFRFVQQTSIRAFHEWGGVGLFSTKYKFFAANCGRNSRLLEMQSEAGF